MIDSFKRSPATGRITGPLSFACDSDYAPCAITQGPFAQLAAIALSADGANAYVAAEQSDAVDGLKRYRKGETFETDVGYLLQPTTDDRFCVVWEGHEPDAELCDNTGRALDGAASVAVSPDGLNVYAAAKGSAAVVAFARSQQRSPVCSPSPATVRRNSPSAVRLGCADPDGDPLSFTIIAQPVHGTLGAVDAATGTVTYTPAADFPRAGAVGEDSFIFEVSDGIEQPVEATQTLAILAEPASPGEAARGAGAGGPTSVRIFGRALRVLRSGRVRVGLRCRSADHASRCTGTLTLSTDSRLNRKSGKRVPALTLGRARYSIPADRTRRVTVHIGHAGRKLLARQPKRRPWVWTRAVATLSGEPAAGQANSAILLLKVSSRHKQKTRRHR